MLKFTKIVNSIIKRSDIILEILDARFPEESRNYFLEQKLKDKKIIYVLNKADLIDKNHKKKLKGTNPSVYVSAKKRLGSRKLRDLIFITASKINKPKILVGVIGYPNTGKSSVINMLKGKHVSLVSSVSGFTKGEQLIKLSSKIYLIDSPGIIPMKEKYSVKHLKIASIDFSKIKDAENYVLDLIDDNKQQICSYYNLDLNLDSYDILEKIAEKFKKLKKKGELDLDAAARQIIKDWQSGKIK